MTLVAPDVCRFSINGDYLNRPAVNVLDMVVQPEDGSIVGRQDAIEITSRVILNAWVETVMVRFGSSYSFQSVSWVDLNSSSGSVGITTSTPAHTLPLAAGGTGEPLTAALAMLVTKVTTRSRGSRPGRWFLPGFVEQDISGNIWGSGTLSATNDQLSSFLEQTTETGLTSLVKYFPTVVHTRNNGTPSNPNVVYVNNTQITDLQAQGRVSTQRQRNRP